MPRVKVSGVYEWAKNNMNILYGCPNVCPYCYAEGLWKHFRRDKGLPPVKWELFEINYKSLATTPKKADNNEGFLFDYMFPSSHDITEDIVKFDLEKINKLRQDKKISGIGFKKLIQLSNIKHEWTILELYLIKIKELLKSGNSVLIVTKPRINVIKKLCEELWEYRNLIEFRFTITTISEEKREQYEGNAPSIKERIECLKYIAKYSKEEGVHYIVSVSIEPFLDKSPIPLILYIEKYINGTMWIGVMSGKSYEHHSLDNLKKVVIETTELSSEVRVKLRLKDGLKNKLEKHNLKDYITKFNKLKIEV